MSCNGCRVLRKGCSESCALRPCLQWIESPEAQANATVFVAKFFGRAGMISFVSSVPLPQRPALFQSLLYEACGRVVNPVTGAVGLMGSGRWGLCQEAVEAVLRGGAPQPLPEAAEAAAGSTMQRRRVRKRSRVQDEDHAVDAIELQGLGLCLSAPEEKRPGSPSEGSVTTSAGSGGEGGDQPRLLNLFS